MPHLCNISLDVRPLVPSKLCTILLNLLSVPTLLKFLRYVENRIIVINSNDKLVSLNHEVGVNFS